MSNCALQIFSAAPVHRFEVDLRTGQFLMRSTDLFRDDSIPLDFTRTYHSGPSRPTSLGYGNNHPYDIYPVGSRNPYTYIEVVMPDNSGLRFERISKGTGYADAVYEHNETTSSLLHARFSWNGHGWGLQTTDGFLYSFPESYAATTAAQGALIGVTDSNSNKRQLRIERNSARDLVSVIAPDGKWLHVQNNKNHQIISAKDDLGHVVIYSYDQDGRLSAVTSSSGTTRFVYDSWNLIGMEKDGKMIVRNSYQDNRLMRMSLQDGRTFRYEYGIGTDEQISATTVTSPEGKTDTFYFNHDRCPKNPDSLDRSCISCRHR